MLLIGGKYGVVFVGYYYMCQRILQIPVTLISKSVLDVFKRRCAVIKKEENELYPEYISILKIMVGIVIIPSIVGVYFIEDLFVFVLGSEWKVAGEFAKILIPALALRFIVNPLSFIFFVAEKQKTNLNLIILLVISIGASCYFPSTIITTIELISLSYTCFYLLQMFFFLLVCERYRF
jgi:O-antigen/teichoic acid export membrane protein